jgi:hypothetical protein
MKKTVNNIKQFALTQFRERREKKEEENLDFFRLHLTDLVLTTSIRH